MIQSPANNGIGVCGIDQCVNVHGQVGHIGADDFDCHIPHTLFLYCPVSHTKVVGSSIARFRKTGKKKVNVSLTKSCFAWDILKTQKEINAKQKEDFSYVWSNFRRYDWLSV